MRRIIPCALVTLSITLAACSEPVVEPGSDESLDSFRASKQGTTHSQMLVTVYDPAVDESSVARMNDDGTGLIALPGLGAQMSQPAWAPDGKQIVVSSGRLPPVDLYLMNDEGGDVTRLTVAPPGAVDIHAVGFAKGVVFTRSEIPTSSMIYLLDHDGGLTRVTSGSLDERPSPSPKDRSVAFARGGDIWRIDLDTGAETNLTNTPLCGESYPSYSPSGKQIAFVRFGCGLPSGIFVMDDDGTRVSRLTDGPDTDPKWSPDGKRIAFTRTAPSLPHVHVIGADGTGLVELVPQDPTKAYYLGAWSRY